MRKVFLCLILAALLLGGCEKKEVQENGYQIYYRGQDGKSLQAENYLPQSQTIENLMDQLVEKWMTDPENVKLSAAKPKEVSMISYGMENSCLIVNFNDSYYEISNTEEILLRASLVKTMIQVPEIKSVQITVSGEPLKDAMGEVVGNMTAKSFLTAEEAGVDGFESMDYLFYFADEDGMLQEEKREIHYSSSSEKIRVVINELMEGTKKDGLFSVIPKDTKVVSTKIENGLCTINFSEEFNHEVEGVSPDISIYAVVNTLCGLNGVTAVKINIAGDTQSYYLDTIDLSQTFEKRQDLIKTEEQDQKVGVDYLMRKVKFEEQEETEDE